MSIELQEKYQGNSINFSLNSKFRNKAYHHYGSMNTKGILATAHEIDELIERLMFILSKE